MSTLALAARLVCVFGLLALVLWGLKRTDGLKGRRRSTPLQVLSTTRLGKSASLSVVRVHDEEYVLGITGAGVTVVTSRPSPAAEPTAAAAPAVPAPVVGPPTSAQFLRHGWEVLRKRPVDAVDVSDDALATALAQARGLEGPAAAPVADTRFATDLADAVALAAAAPVGHVDHPLGPYEDHPLEPLQAEPGLLDTLFGDAPSPTAADGSAAALPRRAPRRPRISTDAAPREELATWSRTRRPAFRSTEEDSVAV